MMLMRVIASYRNMETKFNSLVLKSWVLAGSRSRSNAQTHDASYLYLLYNKSASFLGLGLCVAPESRDVHTRTARNHDSLGNSLVSTFVVHDEHGVWVVPLLHDQNSNVSPSAGR